MNTTFSHALRIVICDSCGAEVHASPGGGKVECDVCATVLDVLPRREVVLAEPSMEESDRIAILAEQDRGPILMPEELHPLVEEGMLAADKAVNAMAVWQETRAALMARNVSDDTPPEDPTELRFYFLTRLLYEHMVGQDDDLRLRGIIESSLETSHSPRYQQVFRCMLACEAARVDDLTGADDWLAPCDGFGVDIQADSVYRYAASYVATHKRQFRKVLALLGVSGADVPIVDVLDPICTVLRANAHEQLGNLDDSVYELAQGMMRIEDGPRVVDATIRNTGELILCRRSLYPARKQVTGWSTMPPPKPTAHATAPSAPPAVAKQRNQLLTTLPWVALTVLFLALALITDQSTEAAGQRLDVLFLVLGISSAMPLVIMALRTRRNRLSGG